MRNFWRCNSLTIVLVTLLLACLLGQILTGHVVYNQERLSDGGLPLGLLAYLRSGHFVSATFENWESEFLQMGMYVLLTVKLRQKGSAESRPLDPAEESDNIRPGPRPWPLRAGGTWAALYRHSLAIAFLVLFLMAFALHLDGSWHHELAQRALRGEPPVSLATFATGAQFWFESMQNWQSEFLAVATLVVLTIWLRQHQSPQSKPLEAPHSQTGT